MIRARASFDAAPTACPAKAAEGLVVASKRSQAQEFAIPPGTIALALVWLAFYAFVLFHGRTMPSSERLAKAVAVEDHSEGEEGIAGLVRVTLNRVHDVGHSAKLPVMQVR